MKQNAQTALLIGILGLMCLVLSSGVKADSILLGGVSTHLFADDDDYNQSHDLFAAHIDNFAVARFTNSHGRESYAAAYGLQWHRGDFRADLYLGAVRGYRKCYSDDGVKTVVCPLAVPAVSYTGWGMVQPTALLLGKALTAAVRIQW